MISESTRCTVQQ